MFRDNRINTTNNPNIDKETMIIIHELMKQMQENPMMLKLDAMYHKQPDTNSNKEACAISVINNAPT